ncbi:MAG: transketolase [Deltaproteobacteria bacterium]|nr:transketolase [Deltaproteobacteria bacterium]
MQNSFDDRCINTLRFLAADAIQKADSGHPGMPMGAASMAYILWMKHLRHNPANPSWPDRDRFILSAGHGSMLLYALLHLTGYDLSMEDIQSFRQWGSRTPGHPESHITPGVEATTGPLGQGIGNAVGMAMAEAHLAACFNRQGHYVVDHCTYVIAGDGDLMEGVASEACSIAGHLGLGKLIVLYDSNRISLSGSTHLSFTEDVAARFEAYGWHTVLVTDGNDLTAINIALISAQQEKKRPSLIVVNTIIGFGSPGRQGTFKAHGSPLGIEELLAAKKELGWDTDKEFFIPEDVLRHFRTSLDAGRSIQAEWEKDFERYRRSYPELADDFLRRNSSTLPHDWDTVIREYVPQKTAQSTRKSSETILQALAGKIPELIGGSADLNPSTFTWLKGYGDFESKGISKEGVQGTVGPGWDYTGRNIHFGVREHAMGAIAAGMSLHGGTIPYTATFLSFADYMRPPIRLACLSGIRMICVFTHDSIGLGEDGPTHQPVEQIMSLRSIPNLTVVRPADALETAYAWKIALGTSQSPTALVLTRQDVPVLDRKECARAELTERGAYILWESGQGKPDIILMATGSEVHIALEAGRRLAAAGTAVRVVSMPSWEIFDRQNALYRQEVLPGEIRSRVAVEAGITLGWEHYVGLDGAVVGMKGFGASAPASVLFEKFGITAEHVVEAAQGVLSLRKKQ